MDEVKQATEILSASSSVHQRTCPRRTPAALADRRTRVLASGVRGLSRIVRAIAADVGVIAVVRTIYRNSLITAIALQTKRWTSGYSIRYSSTEFSLSSNGIGTCDTGVPGSGLWRSFGHVTGQARCHGQAYGCRARHAHQGFFRWTAGVRHDQQLLNCYRVRPSVVGNCCGLNRSCFGSIDSLCSIARRCYIAGCKRVDVLRSITVVESQFQINECQGVTR
ncbi:hypothetical protein F5Y14DRAFT_85737 [Nemania sp. NC0429]|nr:hypothetical protein F5Y14DRAFT_85737 [Nemania sp. NC0429]